MRTRAALVLMLFFSLCSSVAGKDKKVVLTWPSEKPLIQVSFADFEQFGSAPGKAAYYVLDLEVENISDTVFPTSDLTLVFYDKENAIVGNSTLYIAQRLEPHQKVKQQINFSALGKPARVAFGVKDIAVSQTHKVVAHAVSMTFRSLPEGANIQIDTQQLGVTPKVLRVPEGSHLLMLTKSGYTTAEYPFEVRAEDANGGAVEIELSAPNDILELRDGTTVSGDVESVSWEAVRVMIGDKKIDYPRNQIKRIVFVQRQFPDKPSEHTNDK